MASPLKSSLSGLLVCALCFCLLSFHASAYEIKDFDKVLVHVLHRHGARMPTKKPNQTSFCDEAPCGQLTENGARMVEEAGKFLSNMYTSGPNPLFAKRALSKELEAEGAVAKPEYNLHDVYSRSTDVDRTIQSAVSFLRGFFKQESDVSFAPAVHTVPHHLDTLLLTYLQPNLGYYYLYRRVTLVNAVNPATDKAFPDWKLLMEIAKQINLKEVCDSEENRTECAFVLFDIAASMASSGKIKNYSLLEANFKKLQDIYKALLDFESYFDYDNEQLRREGSRGYIYWKQVLKNMEDKISGNMSFKMIHYSAHDITLTPITGSLLDRSYLGMLPPFAQTLVVELLKMKTSDVVTMDDDGKGASASSSAAVKPLKSNYFVHVFRGHPGQTPDTNFIFNLDHTLQLKCLNSSGALYNAVGNICPLEDFERMLEKGAPTDPRGSCLLEQELVDVVNCPDKPALAYELDEKHLLSVAVPPICKAYRKICPEAACMNDEGVKGILDLKTLLCVDNQKSFTKTENKEVLSKALTFIIPVSLFAVGLAVATIIGIKCMKRRPKVEEVGQP